MIPQEAIQRGTRLLTEKLPNSTTPYLDTLLLLGTVLRCSQEEVLLSRKALTRKEEALFTKYLQERASGIPIAYIRKKKEFYGREFFVSPEVLIPRPDTEILIEAVLNLLETTTPTGSLSLPYHATQGTPIQILDLCTGSGCIGITLQAELSNSEVLCSDLSADALTICKKNSFTLLDREIATLQSNLFSEISKKFHIIATNPPYLSNQESDEIIEKGWNEPDMAFRGGVDGLDLIRTIIAEAPKYLEKSGHLFIEAASEQAEIIKNLMTQNGFTDILHHKDLSGAIRVTSGRLHRAD